MNFPNINVICIKLACAIRATVTSNTQDPVSRHSRSPPLLVVFSTLFLLFENVVKHGPTCLIYNLHASIQIIRKSILIICKQAQKLDNNL